MLVRMKLSVIGLLCGMTVLSGCAKDRRFLPPAENEYVAITIKVPQELRAEPMQVMYRSSICKRSTYDSNGRRSDIDGYYGFDTSFQNKGESDLYEAILPRHGGGDCQWNLSNVTFGVIHRTPEVFGWDVSPGGGGGVIIVFDNNNAQHGSARFTVDGDVFIKKDYYPWVREGFLGGHYKYIDLFAGDFLYLGYKARFAKQVYFEPIIHSDLVTYSAGPKVKKKGNNPIFTYPDGRVVADGSTEPDLEILEVIRANSKSKK